MTIHDDDRPREDSGDQSGRSSASARPASGSRRTRIAVGAAGLAVVLGGGAYLITSQLTGDNSAGTGDVGAIGTVVPAGTSSAPSGTADAVTAPPSSAAPSTPFQSIPSPGTSTSANSAAVRKEVDEARAKAAKDGHPLVRPLQAAANELPPGAVHTATEKSPDGGTIRVTTAKADLEGQQDLELAADGGTKHGDADCTNKLHFSNNETPRVIPNLLLCWHTSATRSVVTLAVAPKGKPSVANSTAVISREWAKLG
jgi:hypothetical protein